MPIEPIAPETLQASQDDLIKEHRLDSPLRIINTDAVVALGTDTSFNYRRHGFLMLPVSFRLGARLQQLKLAMQETQQLIEESENASGELADLSQQVVDLIWTAAFPANPLNALRKKLRLMRNPFRDATDGEVWVLLNFFLQRRMLSTVRAKSSAV